MGDTINKIIGLKKTDFDRIIGGEDKKKLHHARLIPTYKPGDEMALTSIFLSSIRLIKEFKKDLFSEVNILKNGKVYVYTEVVFPEHEDSRVDGLIIVTIGGVIKDAAILEIKNKNNILDENQILKYLELAKRLIIPKIITISNQFVSEPTQSPLNVKVPKNVEMYHFSWSYILTLAKILLFKNENNIEDEDQVEIMNEVVKYLEDGVSGVCGFNQMKQGWKEVVEKINAGTRLKPTEECVEEAVTSWKQEERDMALKLSRKLGVLVRSGDSKFKYNLKQRIENDSKTLINDKQLISTLKIKGAVSDIKVKALFEKRIIEMSVRLKVPRNKGVKGQIGWLKRQINTCQKKAPKIFPSIIDELKIDINIKYAVGLERIAYNNIDNIYNEIKNKEINEFGIIQIKDFGKSFSSKQKFVEVIEDMLVNYYKGIVQYLYNWEQPAPKITDEETIDQSESK